MRITHDKNGDPFGFCESNCNQQLRVGGDKRRVALFLARYPWAGGPVTDTGVKPGPAEIEKPVTGAEKAREKEPTRAGFKLGFGG
jgi:hypothetical protein